MMEITSECSCYDDCYKDCYEDCYVQKSDCEYLEGNVSKPIEVNKNTRACEMRVDLEVERRRTIRLWGQVKDCKGRPVKCALLKLVREVNKRCNKEYEGVAHGVTDCLGLYQFDICVPDNSVTRKYRVLVTKQAVGKEMTVGGAECNPCHDNCYCTD